MCYNYDIEAVLVFHLDAQLIRVQKSVRLNKVDKFENNNGRYEMGYSIVILIHSEAGITLDPDLRD